MDAIAEYVQCCPVEVADATYTWTDYFLSRFGAICVVPNHPGDQWSRAAGS
jgi:hypothetical protein